jgi:hypothetical protein
VGRDPRHSNLDARERCRPHGTISRSALPERLANHASRPRPILWFVTITLFSVHTQHVVDGVPRTTKAAGVRNLGGLRRRDCLRRSPRLRLRNHGGNRAASSLDDTACCSDGSGSSFRSPDETQLDRDSFKVREERPHLLASVREWST